jgi:hypothetical protein
VGDIRRHKKKEYEKDIRYLFRIDIQNTIINEEIKRWRRRENGE